MEVIRGTVHAVFPLDDASWVGEARRHALQLADGCGLDETQAGRLALVVTELGTNLLRHARRGRLLLAGQPARCEVEVVAIDEGPGIPDVERCFRDGFSTGSTPGTGLGAIRRLADDFDIHSAVPSGTVAVARVRGTQAAQAPQPPSGICFGALSIAAPGERVCGDGWGIALEGDFAALLVVDGLGHGAGAAEAAGQALTAFEQDARLAPREQVQRLHGRLRATRGAALAVMHARADEGIVHSAGAGNVVGRLVSGVSDRTVLTQHGTAGVTIRTPEQASTPWPPHAMLAVCSDGIETRWKAELVLPVLRRDPVLAAALLLRDHCRGRDDATVAVLRRKD